MADLASKSSSSTLDWELFRSKSVAFSPEQLDRYSRSGVDLTTIEITKELCKAFPISLNAKGHFQKTFKSLPEIDKDSDRRETGLISEIAESEEGLLLLGIISILSEYYDDTSVATIFDELAKWTKLPADLLPTLRSWQTVATLLGCKLDSDEFSSVVDTYTKLGQDNGTLGLQHTDGSSVAAVLNLMADMVRGQHRGVCIAFVGKDAGWLAAVATWLFELKFELRSRDDRILYTSDEVKIQISIRFKAPGVPVDGIPIENVPLVIREREKKSKLGE